MSLHQKPGSPYLWYDFTIGGIRYRGSTKQKKETLARQVEAKLINDVRTGLVTAEGLRQKTPFLSDFLPRFESNVLPYCRSERTLEYYKNGIRLLRLTTLVNRRMDQITEDHLNEAKFSGGPSNRNNALRTLRRIMSYAVKCMVLMRAPQIKLARENGRSRLMTAEEEILMLGEGCTKTLRASLIVILDCGMRPEEIRNMRWEHVDFEKRVIFVPEGKTTNATRHLPMSSRMVTELGRRDRKESPWVFYSKFDHNRQLQPNSISAAFRKRRDALQIDRKVVLYTSRHTFATDFLGHTGDVAKLKKAMGHSSLKTTDRYLHPEISEMGSIMDARNESRHKIGHSNLTIN